MLHSSGKHSDLFILRRHRSHSHLGLVIQQAQRLHSSLHLSAEIRLTNILSSFLIFFRIRLKKNFINNLCLKSFYQFSTAKEIFRFTVQIKILFNSKAKRKFFCIFLLLLFYSEPKTSVQCD